MKMSTSATVQRKARQSSRIRNVELEKENIEEYDTGAMGNLEKTVTRYRQTIDRGLGKKIDKVADKVDSWADRMNVKYEQQYEKYNQKWNDTVMEKMNEVEEKIREKPFGAWLCMKCCDDSAAMECGEGEENLRICSLRGILDFMYLMTFFMGSAMAATISLTYFEPKVNDKSPEQPYAKSFLAGDYCNDYDTIAGRIGLDGLRAGLTFFSPENSDHLFENGAGTRCTDSLANYGLLGLTDFEAFAKNISDRNGTVADPFIFGGSVEMIQKYKGDPIVLFAAAGDSGALAELQSDIPRAILLWNGAGVQVPGGSDLLSSFPDADPPTNWEWCMNVYEDDRSQCDKYILNVARYPNYDPCLFLYEINMPYTSAPASQEIITRCQDWTYVNPHGPKPTARPTRYPVDASSNTTVDYDKCNAEWIGDQRCDPDCNYAIFGFDGGDCDGVDPNDFKDECDFGWLGDGYCDEACNSEEYSWDFGDCGGDEDHQPSGQCQDWCSSLGDDLFVICDDYQFQCGGCEICGPMCTEQQMDEEAPQLIHDALFAAGGFKQFLGDLEHFLFCEPDFERIERNGGDINADECMRQKCQLNAGIIQHVDLTPAAFQCSVEPGIPDGNIATWFRIENSHCNGEEPANDPWRDAYENGDGEEVECGASAAESVVPMCFLCGSSPGECDSNDCSWDQNQQRCLPEGSSGVDGETACENHGFSFNECMTVGCCQWDHQYGQCWSNVGRNTCEAGTGDNNGGGGGGGGGGEAACENHGYGYDRCMNVGCCQWDHNEGECYSAVGDSPCNGGNGGGGHNGGGGNHGGGNSGNGEAACERHGYGYDQCMNVGCCQWDGSEGECYSAVGNGPCDRRRIEDTFTGQFGRRRSGDDVTRAQTGRRLLNAGTSKTDRSERRLDWTGYSRRRLNGEQTRGTTPDAARRRTSKNPTEHCAALSTAATCNADSTCAYDSRTQTCIIILLHCKKFSAENLCVADGKCSWTPPAPAPAPGPAPADGGEPRRRFGGGGFSGGSSRSSGSSKGKCAAKKKSKCPDYTDMASCDAQDPKCRWNISLNKCDVKPVVRKPRSAVKKLPSLDDEYCMKKTKTIGQIQRLEKFSTTFNATKEDYDVIYKLGCVKDWAKEDSDEKRQAVFEMYILSLLFYVFLIFDMNQFIQKTFWAMVFRVTFSLTYIYEFSLFVGYWQKGQQDEAWFDIVTWPFVDFSTATKSDAYIAKFLRSVMTTRGLSVTVIVICVLFGKVKGSSARVNENMNARRGFNLLYFVLVLGLSTICAVMSLYAYQADEVTDGIAASNFIGGTCGDGVMGKHIYELYPTGWQTDPNTDHKMLNCINVKISNNFQQNIRMYVVAYTSTLLFYVYLLHNVRNEFTKRGSWVLFRVLFICAYMTEYMYWMDFHSAYKELKMEYKTTHQIHPEAAIITKLTHEVYKCRIAVVSVLVLIQILEDMLCKRISNRLCCDGKLEEDESEVLKLTEVDLEMTAKRTPGSPKPEEVAKADGSSGLTLNTALRELSTQI